MGTGIALERGNGYGTVHAKTWPIRARLRGTRISRATFIPSLGHRNKIYSIGIVDAGDRITSRGPGTALDFSYKLVERLVSKEKSDELRAGMLAA